MSEGPLVSVCLPVFNGGQFLKDAIASILAQTWGTLELVVCDDGSSDGSLEVIGEFAERDNRVRVFSNQHRLGLFENYNETLRRSTGVYVKPFAQDDTLTPDALERMVGVLENESSVSLVGCARRWIDGRGQEVEMRRTFPSSRRIPAREVVTFNLINLNNWVGEPSAVMFRRSLAGLGFDPNYYHYGDIEYWFRILETGDFFFLEEPLCSFRRHAASETDRNHRELLFALDIIRLSWQYRHVLDDIEPEEVFRRRLAETLCSHVQHLQEQEIVDVNEYGRRLLEPASGGTPGGAEELRRRSEGFRLMSVLALSALAETQSALDHEKRCRAEESARFAREVEKMQNSLYWKITNPLRNLRNALKR